MPDSPIALAENVMLRTTTPTPDVRQADEVASPRTSRPEDDVSSFIRSVRGFGYSFNDEVRVAVAV